ncbi:ABC transporter ATP-binding protein [Leifsonia naganoensis]|uniref:ABC-2 type transport system ATP-binding protein n=1 Tax=Leifsonia naganoensis TaxID=150025 RepID=A0A853DRS5_9MICO|nr:ABC transporter ATP-binding protein [Leifsonia naganoensis]NYK09061.1 ABC-2 type transport system ATP-binding protein [Leifsonia naganoensis]
MSNAITIRSMSRSFGRSTALDDITLTVPEESICGLLGRNGAGKTTIMSILAGQDRPSSGTAEVFGERPFENEAILSKISFVRDNQKYPDNYRLHHVLRIAPEFAPNWNADVAAELVDGFRIPTKTPIKKFSRGQLSAIAIVMGLASRAPLTLLDEPYLGLDVTARALFHDMLLRDYTAHPRTVVLSTHLIEESEALFDHVLIIDRGRVRAACASDEITDLAFTVSGSTDAVQLMTAGRDTLLSHTVGGLKSATISGAVDDDLLSHARTLGVTIAPASLQELVAAFGADTPQLELLTKGARA